MTKSQFNHATFLLSAAQLRQLPADRGIEVAFAGRSNAGKSSGLNAIAGIKKLARSSKTPGRTQLINIFVLDEQRRLVDLPGYGYAKVPEAVKARWQQTLGEYLEKRNCLKGMMLFMDIRHPLKDLDLQMLEWAIHSDIAVHILLTKADKLSRGAGIKTLLEVKKTLADYGDKLSIQLFSAPKQLGVEEAQAKLVQWYQAQNLAD